MKNFFIFVLLVAFFVVFWNFRQKGPDILTVSLGEVSLTAAVADNDLERMEGLSGKKSLGANEGMLFIFDRESDWGIWMKDMSFPIDIAWINAKKKIVHIEQDVSPQTYPEVFKSSNLILYVLETQAGFFAKNNIKIGDIVAF